MAGEQQELVYRVDQQDVVVFVDSEWDRFAASNGGEKAMSAQVVGRPLWNFLVDPTTRQLYRQLLQRIREGREVRFGFRCDSPDRRRLMEMEMGPAEKSVVQFRARTVSETEREPQRLWDRREAHSGDFLVACGWCKKVRVDDSWEEVEDAVTQLRFFERSVLPALTHGICEKCHRNVLRTLELSNEIETSQRQ